MVMYHFWLVTIGNTEQEVESRLYARQNRIDQDYMEVKFMPPAQG